MEYIDFILDLKYFGHSILSIQYDIVQDIWIVKTTNQTHIYALG